MWDLTTIYLFPTTTVSILIINLCERIGVLIYFFTLYKMLCLFLLSLIKLFLEFMLSIYDVKYKLLELFLGN